jgi:plastocyanin
VRALPAPPPPPTVIGWEGRIEDATSVQLGTVTPFIINTADRRVEWSNDYAVSPSRVRTKAGMALTFKNNTKVPHTLSARDGSWGVGPIKPGESGSVTIAKAGAYEYFCKDHPWSIGQIVVE